MSENSLAIRKFSDLANPTRFLALAARVLPWFAGLTVLLFAAGLYLSFTTEGDYQQGETVRIMYIHVPFAWLAMMCYTLMAVSALGTLVWRHPLADVALKSAAPIGAVFTALALITGSIWGKPMWGTWWVWDARLTSVFVLFLMYLGIIALTRALDDARTRRLGRRHHHAGRLSSTSRSSNSRSTGGTRCISRLGVPHGRLDHRSSLLWPLLVMALGFTVLFFALHLMAMRTEIRRRRVIAMRRALLPIGEKVARRAG
jgi:heme exporter protein C